MRRRTGVGFGYSMPSGNCNLIGQENECGAVFVDSDGPSMLMI